MHTTEHKFSLSFKTVQETLFFLMASAGSEFEFQ